MHQLVEKNRNRRNAFYKESKILWKCVLYPISITLLSNRYFKILKASTSSSLKFHRKKKDIDIV